jgi:hypothetical protein
MSHRKTKNGPHIYFFGEAKQLVNGQLIADKALETTYDGKVLHVDERNNNKVSHFTVKDKVLSKLLTNPSSETDLIERLKRDFTKGQSVRRKPSVRHKRKSVRHKRKSVRHKRQSIKMN